MFQVLSVVFVFSKYKFFNVLTKLQHYLTIRRLSEDRRLEEKFYLWFCIFDIFCIPHNIVPKSKWHIFFKIAFNRLVLSTSNKNRSLDLSIKFANINTTNSNTLLIIAQFFSNGFILVYLQRDLLRNYILWKQWFLDKF